MAPWADKGGKGKAADCLRQLSSGDGITLPASFHISQVLHNESALFSFVMREQGWERVIFKWKKATFSFLKKDILL